MQHKKELEKYEARMQRIEQKLSALAERVSRGRSGSRQGDADRVADAGPQPRRSGTPRITSRRVVSGQWTEPNAELTTHHLHQPPTALVLGPLRLVRQIALVPHLLDLVELRLEPVHVLFLVLQQLREQLA